MARQGLMDDCGYDFEPSVAEEQAWNDGYEAALIDFAMFLTKRDFPNLNENIARVRADSLVRVFRRDNHD